MRIRTWSVFAELVTIVSVMLAHGLSIAICRDFAANYVMQKVMRVGIASNLVTGACPWL